MLTQILTVEELKQLFDETLFNKTDKVTKISPGSVLNAISYGNAKLGQKILKDIAVIEAHLFPDTATGEYLDKLAKIKGCSTRKQSSQSSTYIRIFGTPGTQYFKNVHIFSGSNGVLFDLESDITIPVFGFTYAKVRSQLNGSNMNVEPLTISKVSPIPTGHQYVINEYHALGGRDIENDKLFRNRIKREINSLAKNTLASLEQLFLKVNPNIMKCYHYGYTSTNKVRIGIATQNGIDLTQPELNALLIASEQWLSLFEMRTFIHNTIGIELVNIDWQPIDISFRCDIHSSYNIDEVRKNVQVNLNKYLDYRYWDITKKVEWDDLLQIVKSTDGIKYIPDNHFFPNLDITINKYKLPRIRGFQMLNLNGGLITNLTGTLNPIFYPNEIDFYYQADVLSSIN